jgi:hypothetical protein
MLRNHNAFRHCILRGLVYHTITASQFKECKDPLLYHHLKPYDLNYGQYHKTKHETEQMNKHNEPWFVMSNLHHRNTDM